MNSLATNQSIPPEYQKDEAGNNPLLQKLKELLENRLSSVDGNFLLLNRTGAVMANYTKETEARIITPKASRDYFQVASKMTNGFYVSRGYTSESDDKTKIAVIAPIMYGNQFIGALGRMVAYRELGTQTERTKLAVISEMDPSTAYNHQYAVIWHPNLAEKEMVPIWNEDPLRQKLDAVLKGSRHTVTSYKDPVDSGQWVAGLAKVPAPGSQPHLIVVYQVRNRVRQALVVGMFVFLPWLVALGIWVIRKRLPKGTT